MKENNKSLIYCILLIAFIEVGLTNYLFYQNMSNKRQQTKLNQKHQGFGCRKREQSNIQLNKIWWNRVGKLGKLHHLLVRDV